MSGIPHVPSIADNRSRGRATQSEQFAAASPSIRPIDIQTAPIDGNVSRFRHRADEPSVKELTTQLAKLLVRC